MIHTQYSSVSVEEQFLCIYNGHTPGINTSNSQTIDAIHLVVLGFTTNLRLHRFAVLLLEQQRLLEDQLLEHLLWQVVQLHGDAEGLLGDRLVSRIVILLQVGMRQGLLHRIPVVWIEGQHLVEQVQRTGVCLGEQLVPRHLRLERQRLQVVSCLKTEERRFYSNFIGTAIARDTAPYR